jgi:siroheme synthase
VLVVSGHAPAAYAPLLATLPPAAATVVVLMGMAERGGIAACLDRAGWAGDTPAAIVSNASRPEQHVWHGTLGELAAGGGPDLDAGPGVIIIGEVVSLAGAADRAVFRSAEEKPWQSTTIPRR